MSPIKSADSGRAGAAVPADAEQVAAAWAFFQARFYADPARHARAVLARADPDGFWRAVKEVQAVMLGGMRRSNPALIAPTPAPLPLSPAGVVA